MIRWPVVAGAAILGLIPSIIMTVWTVPLGLKYFSYFAQYALQSTTPAIFTWLSDLLPHDAELRALILGISITFYVSLPASYCIDSRLTNDLRLGLAVRLCRLGGPASVACRPGSSLCVPLSSPAPLSRLFPDILIALQTSTAGKSASASGSSSSSFAAASIGSPSVTSSPTTSPRPSAGPTTTPRQQVPRRSTRTTRRRSTARKTARLLRPSRRPTLPSCRPSPLARPAISCRSRCIMTSPLTKSCWNVSREEGGQGNLTEGTICRHAGPADAGVRGACSPSRRLARPRPAQPSSQRPLLTAINPFRLPPPPYILSCRLLYASSRRTHANSNRRNV